MYKIPRQSITFSIYHVPNMHWGASNFDLGLDHDIRELSVRPWILAVLEPLNDPQL